MARPEGFLCASASLRPVRGQGSGCSAPAFAPRASRRLWRQKNKRAAEAQRRRVFLARPKGFLCASASLRPVRGQGSGCSAPAFAPRASRRLWRQKSKRAAEAQRRRVFWQDQKDFSAPLRLCGLYVGRVRAVQRRPSRPGRADDFGDRRTNGPPSAETPSFFGKTKRILCASAALRPVRGAGRADDFGDRTPTSDTLHLGGHRPPRSRRHASFPGRRLRLSSPVQHSRDGGTTHTSSRRQSVRCGAGSPHTRAGGLCLRDATVVDTRERYVAALAGSSFDLSVLAAYSLPGLDGLTRARDARETDPLKPFILVSGTVGEEAAIAAMRAGAADYVLEQPQSAAGLC